MTSTQRKHILEQFDAELEALKSRLLAMGGIVERQVTEAISAFVGAETERARRVIEGDREVNDLERGIDERCIGMLALRQPEASDLRFIAATNAARKATSVLPKPTSPQISRSMGLPETSSPSTTSIAAC